MEEKRVEERPLILQKDESYSWRTIFPFLSWMKQYHREDFGSDLLAGVILTAVLVPQAMAYAMLAGLPPAMGLYASIIPTFIYGFFGTSRILSVAPVAVISLMVGSSLAELAEVGSVDYMQLAIVLALFSGLLQLFLGGLRIGFLVNFLSYPVLIGFTSSAALIIATSQLKHLLGISMPRASFFESLYYLVFGLGETNFVTLVLGGGSLAILLYFKYLLPKQVVTWPVPKWLRVSISKSGALFVVVLGIIAVWAGDLASVYGVAVVGDVPNGLPDLGWVIIDWEMGRRLIWPAVMISFVGYIQSMSVAKLVASKDKSFLDLNQEFVALGLANLGSALSGGMPVTGGFSRSVVNFSLGARTGLASIITAVLVGVTVIYLTPIFYYLPQATLASIIVMAVFGLFDWDAIKSIWGYSKGDGWGMGVTFAAVLLLGVDLGILSGILFAFTLFVWRATHPQMVEVVVVGEKERERISVRIEAAISFVNISYVEELLLQLVIEKKGIKELVICGEEIYLLDKSGAEGLLGLQQQLRGRGVELYLVGLPSFVYDHLKRVGFVDLFGVSFISTAKCY